MKKSEKMKSILKKDLGFLLFCVLAAEKGEGVKCWQASDKQFNLRL